MNKLRSGLIVGGIVVLGVLPIGLAATPAATPPSSPAIPAVEDELVVCAAGFEPGTILVAGAAPVEAAALAATEVPETVDTSVAEVADPMVLASTKRFVAATHVVDGDTQGWATCAEPQTTGVVQLPDASVSDLLLVNPDPVAAEVDFTLSGPTGELVAVGSQGVSVPPNSSTLLPVSVLVDGSDPVGVSMQVTSGRLGVVGRSWGGDVGDFSQQSLPSTSILLPGVFPDAAEVEVLVTNSGTDRATVSIGALTTQRIALEGGQDQVIEPGQTTSIALGDVLGAEAATLEVVSDHPVTATAVVSTKSDYAISSAAAEFLDGRLISPGGGTLSVTNPNDAPVNLTLSATDADGTVRDEQEVSITAGQTWTLQAPSDDVVVYNLLASGPVVAAVTQSKATGAYVADVEPMTQPDAVDVRLAYNFSLA